MAGRRHGSRPGATLLAIIISLSPFVHTIRSATTANAIESSDHSTPSPDTESTEEKGERLTFTCRDRCGEVFDMPCSCNALCLVYDTCCENFTQDCPNDASHGRDKLAPYIGARITCDDEYFFKITSCPTSDKTSNERLSSVNFPNGDAEADLFYVASTRPIVQLSASEIERVVTNAPVTDSDSSITFLNMFVYNCYASLGLTSQPLHWNLNLLDFRADDYQVGNIVNVSSSHPYSPAFSTKGINFLNHKCTKGIIDSCDNANSSSLTESKREYYASKCKDFAGYVSSKDGGKQFYRNRYCAYCHDKDYSSLHFETVNYSPRKFAFNTLVSLQQDGTVKFETKVPPIGSWTSTLICPALDSLFQEARDVDSGQQVTGDAAKAERCHAECVGDKRLFASSDGLCKINQYEKIAFSQDDLPPLSCWSALERAARFITCVLDLTQFGYEYMELYPPEVSVVRDSRTGKTLYVADLAFASPRASYELSDHPFWGSEGIHDLSIAIKAFQAYRYSHNLCVSALGQTTSQQILDHRLSDVEDTVNTWDLALLNEDFVGVGRGEVVDRYNTTTVCATEITTSPDMKYLTLSCLDDPMFEGDESKIVQVLNSTCVSLLKEVEVPSSKSCGNMAHAQRFVSFYYFYVAVQSILQIVTAKRRLEGK